MLTMEGFLQKRVPSPYKRLVLDRLLTVFLNYTDLITDILVMLQYGCFLQHTLSTNCTTGIENVGNVTTSWIPTCEPHWWWFGLSLSILVVSTVAHAFVYTIRPGQNQKFCCFCCLGIFQLTYLRDLWLAVLYPTTAEAEEEKHSTVGRDFTVKILECTPQLYLQTFVLFSIQAHGDRLKVVSTLLSAASLALGLVKFMAAQSVYQQKFLQTFARKLTVGLFLTTDQLLRASAYSLMLSEVARPLGIPIILLFPVLSLIICYKALGRSGFGGFCLAFSVGVLAGHILPLFSLTSTLGDSTDFRGPAWWQEIYFYLALPLRYIEMTFCGVVGLTVAKTTCGHVPVIEMITFFSLMVGNLVFFIAMFFCMSKTQVNPTDELQAKPDSPPMTLVGANSVPQGN